MNFSEDLIHLVAVDRRFSDLKDDFGLPNWEKSDKLFHPLCKGIIYQQLSGKAASTIYKRFLEFYCNELPTRQQILNTEVEKLRTIGLSRNKAQYIKNIAEYFSIEPDNFNTCKPLTNKEISKRLLEIKGIGQWTIDLALMSSFGRKDVLPTGDLGVRKGLKIYFSLDSLPIEKEMYMLTQNWKPFRSLGSWFMWQLVDSA